MPICFDMPHHRRPLKVAGIDFHFYRRPISKVFEAEMPVKLRRNSGLLNSFLSQLF